ncbi:hypothetical protein MIND_00901500 [Mycena indigotica]|uniref:Uncharacterized protein n=1 Tax=Mycena indigotica TaxID=2126181 RepID=A0A8H6SIK8_9AGAR|nr:uncharacterized protein MIND_00901500 [Mycena indigotica]KAF7299512.1 hypothetical protein MIND_00901500 [Mycena indigotica]
MPRLSNSGFSITFPHALDRAPQPISHPSEAYIRPSFCLSHPFPSFPPPFIFACPLPDLDVLAKSTPRDRSSLILGFFPPLISPSRLRPSSRPSSARMLSHLRLKTRFALPLVVPDIWWELSMAGHGLLVRHHTDFVYVSLTVYVVTVSWREAPLVRGLPFTSTFRAAPCLCSPTPHVLSLPHTYPTRTRYLFQVPSCFTAIPSPSSYPSASDLWTNDDQIQIYSTVSLLRALGICERLPSPVDPSSAVGPPANEHEYSHCFLRLAVIKYSRALSPPGLFAEDGELGVARNARTRRIDSKAADSKCKLHILVFKPRLTLRQICLVVPLVLAVRITDQGLQMDSEDTFPYPLQPRLPAVILLPLGVLAVHYRPERAAATTAVETAIFISV